MDRSEKVILKVLILVVVVFLVIIPLFLSSIYMISPGENGVVINRLNGETTFVDQAGVHLKKPFVETVKTSTTKEQVYAYSDTGNSKDQLPITYNTQITYKVVDTNKLYLERRDLREENTQQLINTVMTEALDVVSSQYDYTYIKSNVAKVGSEIQDYANSQLKDKYGIEIVNVSISSVNTTPEMEASITNKLVKEQEAQASEQEVVKAQNNAEAQKIMEQSVSQEQQQNQLCAKAIESGDGDSPACYYGDGTYVNGGSVVAQ
jgi:regulator of protease activity HflC (stomatin/prohibitin superfamily)